MNNMRKLVRRRRSSASSGQFQFVRIRSPLYKKVRTAVRSNSSSIDRFVNDAIETYLRQGRQEKKHKYEQAFHRLREEAQRDPSFDQAIAALVEAELKYDDPLEGTPFIPTADKGDSPGGETENLSQAKRELKGILESA